MGTLIIVSGFNAPKQGDRIEIPSRPGEYMVVTEKPQTGRDARGLGFWRTRVKDRTGAERSLTSDEVKSWQHFTGPLYDWHQEEMTRQEQEKKRKEQTEQVSSFEEKFRYPDGQTLRERVPPMVVKVKPGAPGNLGAFSGERVAVKNVDYVQGTVRLVPVGEEIDELALTLPADEVMPWTEPAMPVGAALEKVTLQNGQTVDMERVLGMTPGFNRMVLEGKVRVTALQVYVNYQTQKHTGFSKFESEMEALGMGAQAGDNPDGGLFKENHAERKFDEMGRQTSPRGAWQATLQITPPVSKAVEAEIAALAPQSQIIKSAKDGTITVHSNPLFKNMVALGHFEG